MVNMKFSDKALYYRSGLLFARNISNQVKFHLEIGIHVPLDINMLNPGTNVSCVDERLSNDLYEHFLTRVKISGKGP